MMTSLISKTIITNAIKLSLEKIFNNYVRSRVLQQFKISFNEFKENAMSFLLLKKFLIAVYCVQPCVANEEFWQKKS